MARRHAALAAILIAVAGALPAIAAPEPARTAAAPPKVEIERMTWREVRDRIASGADTVIIPTGGTESNGAHMITGKHNFIVAEAARRIARALGNALVAPTIAYVPEGDIAARTGHMAYAGTFSVPDAVFEALLEAAAASAKAHGSRTIVFLGDSGGNQAPQQAVAKRLSEQWAGDGVVVLNADAYYDGAPGEAWLRQQGETDATIGSHAGIRDTSELMAIYPEGVDLTRVDHAANETSGDASRATAARGEHLFALRVEAAVAEIRAAQERQRADAARPGFFARLYQLIFG